MEKAYTNINACIDVLLGLIAIKDENEIVLDYLLNYQHYLEIYENKVGNLKSLGATEYSGMPHASGVGNPTLNKAFSSADLEEWKRLEVVKATEATLSEKSMMYLTLRRLTVNVEYPSTGRRKKTWAEDVAKRYVEWIK